MGQNQQLCCKLYKIATIYYSWCHSSGDNSGIRLT